MWTIFTDNMKQVIFFTSILTTLENVNICLLASFSEESLVIDMQGDITDIFCLTFFVPPSQ